MSQVFKKTVHCQKRSKNGKKEDGGADGKIYIWRRGWTSDEMYCLATTSVLPCPIFMCIDCLAEPVAVPWLVNDGAYRPHAAMTLRQNYSSD
jgi:hypothetical protein